MTEPQDPKQKLGEEPLLYLHDQIEAEIEKIIHRKMMEAVSELGNLLTIDRLNESFTNDLVHNFTANIIQNPVQYGFSQESGSLLKMLSDFKKNSVNSNEGITQ